MQQLRVMIGVSSRCGHELVCTFFISNGHFAHDFVVPWPGRWGEWGQRQGRGRETQVVLVSVVGCLGILALPVLISEIVSRAWSLNVTIPSVSVQHCKLCCTFRGAFSLLIDLDLKADS